MVKEKKACGTWPSPVSARMMAAGLRLSDVQWDTDSMTLVWLEGRGGQGVLVAQTGDNAARDLNDEFSVHARVGYGGGDFTVAQGHVYFAGPEGRLYRQPLSGGRARPIVPAFGHAASPAVSADGQWLVYVHSDGGHDGLAIVDSAGQHWPSKLAYGMDFVMQPCWHPDGTLLAYIAWDHPQMPWDGTELKLLKLDYSGDMPCVESSEVIAGDTETAIYQPSFSPDGRYLAYVSDASGWWQIYLYDLSHGTHRQLTEAEAEHGIPAWVQGMHSYAWDQDRLVYLRSEGGCLSLWQQTLTGTPQRFTALDDYSDLSQIAISPQTGSIALLASAPKIPLRVVTYTPEPPPLPDMLSAADDAPSIQVIVEEETEDAGLRIRRRATSENLLPEQLSATETLEWRADDGQTVYGMYHPPTHEHFEGLGLPPLIIMVHGGPTSQSIARYEPKAQFFTSRGYAVLEVNHRGSSGYGRAYRRQLHHHWGVYDVEDAASGARYLADQGRVDGSKLVIYGGSAGGFTVLQSLVSQPGFYKAGVCLYGISDQFSAALETFKFEAHYYNSLLGPLPEAAAVYRERSPLFHVERIVDPVAIYQGKEDRVVHMNQAEMIAASLKARGVAHEYTLYEGEGHGWRKSETIEAFYQSVARFLLKNVVFA